MDVGQLAEKVEGTERYVINSLLFVHTEVKMSGTSARITHEFLFLFTAPTLPSFSVRYSRKIRLSCLCPFPISPHVHRAECSSKAKWKEMFSYRSGQQPDRQVRERRCFLEAPDEPLEGGRVVKRRPR